MQGLCLKDWMLLMYDDVVLVNTISPCVMGHFYKVRGKYSLKSVFI